VALTGVTGLPVGFAVGIDSSPRTSNCHQPAQGPSAALSKGGMKKSFSFIGFLGVFIAFIGCVDAYKQLHLCNGSGRRYCANSHRGTRCPETCRPENCIKRPTGEMGDFYTRCTQIRPPKCETIYWEEIAATNMYDYVYLNTTMDQTQGTVCMSTCREEPFRGICLATERGVNGIDYCKQIDCRRLKQPNQSGCHQPRDFHAPTCFECEIMFPLACGGNEGGVLKGWKAKRNELVRQKEFQESLRYNASVAQYAKIVDSTFDDTYRWLNGAAVPKVPDWYMCAKMNADRVQYVESLAYQRREQMQKTTWMAQQNVANAAKCDSSDCPGNDESSDFLDGLASSEGLPHADLWATFGCKNYFKDVLKKYDSEYNDKEDDAKFEVVIDETLDWLPPWVWEPWNQDWTPLPKEMQWAWELIDPDVSVAAGTTSLVPTTLDAAAQLDELLAAGHTQSITDVLQSSSLLSVTLPELGVNSERRPTFVDVTLQVSDTPDTPYSGGEAMHGALASIAGAHPSNVTITEEDRDAVNQIITVTASIRTEDPLAVSVAFAKADRNGQLEVTLKAAGLQYLEVSMTTTVSYSTSGVFDAMVESADNGSAMEVGGGPRTTVAVASVAAVAVVVSILGVVAIKLALARMKSAEAPPVPSDGSPAKQESPGSDTTPAATAHGTIETSTSI